ncbi:hypothetical protein K501DRAFT_212893 [Backusella circina FSU 941]|nr:hypothetical protein K501DRAFT_212893 [Backusella circina FSU 941]
MQNNFTPNENRENASFATTNPMMAPAALFSTDMTFGQPTSYLPFEEYEQVTPIVKSHSNYHLPAQLPSEYYQMVDYTPPSSQPPVVDMLNQTIYSPSTNSVTTNSSMVMMDTLSPVSTSHLMSPTQPMDNYSSYHITTDNLYLDQPILPRTDQPLVFDRNRRQPRRHTVSTPYATTPITKMSKSQQQQQTKAKRHRSMGKIPIDSVEAENLSQWTHEQLLERIRILEKEKEESGVVQEGGLSGTPDTEEEEEGISTCKWDDCTNEFNTLNDLIEHVKTDHIGSGKATYYCSWKDCARKQKPFTKRHKMHNHLRTHTGERPFVCQEPDCGKKFSRPDSLTTHTKIHSNIRPYLCKYANCEKAYYHLRSLRKHERTHSSEDGVPSSQPPLPTMSAMLPALNSEAYSSWAYSAQAAVFGVMDRESYLN